MNQQCSSCNRSEPVLVEQGLAHDHPKGWGVVTVSEQGKMIEHHLLCKSCLERVMKSIW